MFITSKRFYTGRKLYPFVAIATASATWTSPATELVQIVCWGSGQSGQNDNKGGDGGTGSWCARKFNYQVYSGSTYSLVVAGQTETSSYFATGSESYFVSRNIVCAPGGGQINVLPVGDDVYYGGVGGAGTHYGTNYGWSNGGGGGGSGLNGQNAFDGQTASFVNNGTIAYGGYGTGNGGTGSAYYYAYHQPDQYGGNPGYSRDGYSPGGGGGGGGSYWSVDTYNYITSLAGHGGRGEIRIYSEYPQADTLGPVTPPSTPTPTPTPTLTATPGLTPTPTPTPSYHPYTFYYDSSIQNDKGTIQQAPFNFKYGDVVTLTAVDFNSQYHPFKKWAIINSSNVILISGNITDRTISVRLNLSRNAGYYYIPGVPSDTLVYDITPTWV